MSTIVIRTLIIYIILMVVLRSLGKRQVGELDISELINTILLSEIASLPINDPDIPLLQAVIPILIIVCLEITVTFIKNKSSLLKKIFESKCSILINKGVLQQKTLSDMRISIEEFLGELRLKGVSDISEVYYAIIEHNGNLSIILKGEKQPLTPHDMGMVKEDSGMQHPIIVDGQLNEKNMKISGKTVKWVEHQLKAKKMKAEDIFLMTVDDSDGIYIIKRKQGGKK